MLTVYTIEQSEKWDSIVRSFKNYDVYWLSGYVKAFQIHDDGKPLLFHYDDGSTRGVNVIMKRDVAEDERFKGKIEGGQYFDLATPYGYGGWIIEGKETTGLFDAYSAWLSRNGFISEFVRFHPMVGTQDACRKFFNVIQLGEVIHMDLSSPETIWNNITSKNRNKIRKAIKNNVKIYNGRFPEIYEKFRTIYNSTMDKDDAEEYYYFGDQFYTSVLNDLPQYAQVFWAEKDNIVIASSIIIGANGYKILHLGGGVGSGEDNLFKFKRAFYIGDLHHFYIGKKIYDKEKYEELVSIRKKLTAAFSHYTEPPKIRGVGGTNRYLINRIYVAPHMGVAA